VIARVQPLTRTRALRGLFDYRLRADQAEIGVGSLLRIPFGGRRTLGVVVELAQHSDIAPERLAAPDGVLDTSIPAELVALAAWMAREYCSTPARALGLLLAPGATAGARAKRALVADLTPAGGDALRGDTRLSERQRATLARLERQGPTVAAELGTPALRRLESRGLVSLASRNLTRRPARHTVGSTSATAPQLTEDQRQVLAAVLEALAEAGTGSMGPGVVGPGVVGSRVVRPSPGGHTPGTAAGMDVAPCLPREGQRPRRFLLHGVTGSGKTEVYLQAVAATLAAGRSAIVLVPEIALTPQALGRFEARFGDVVAVLHSSLSQGQRYDEWRRLAAGTARVCVGPRSAVFAPLADIGLIVVDEEHEGSYKHEGDPRYDARHVAEQRARVHGAVLLLGSATPRPESVLSATRLRLPSRIDHRPMPPVEVLDMRTRHHPLHPETRMALADLRAGAGKAIVLLNRRGWSNFLSCRACGHVWSCPNCEVALVLHRSASFLACHHCGHREPVPGRCGVCHSVSVARHGAGTERIEHELREALGETGFPIFRLDADSAGLQKRAGTLARFATARSGVLVGTQMVAKGHDFPDVSLGVVIDADQTLRFPDFRAEERTFALVTQLAGRAGRGDRGGRVLVQTLAPEARSIVFASHHDSDGFIADELRHRRELNYPPFSSLIRIVCSAEQEPEARRTATALHARIAAPAATVLGPAPLFALRGRARSQLVIKAGDRSAAIAAVGEAVDRIAPGAARRGVNVSVDVDPQ
jgi:primosomal protein N' (replication factor Y)